MDSILNQIKKNKKLTLENTPFEVQLETVVLDEPVKILDVLQARFQPMSGDGDVIHRVPVHESPCSVLAFAGNQT